MEALMDALSTMLGAGSTDSRLMGKLVNGRNGSLFLYCIVSISQKGKEFIEGVLELLCRKRSTQHGKHGR